MVTPISAAGNPVLVGTPYSARPAESPSYVRELGLKPAHHKAIWVGASVAATLAVVAVIVRARSPRRGHAVDTSSGVIGTIVKSALFAAAQTLVRVGAARLAAKALHHESERTPVETASA